MKLKTSKFGEIKYKKSDVLEFADGLIGFPGIKNFLILNHKECSPFRWLQSIEEPALAFLVVDPVHYFENYAPLMDENLAKCIGLKEDTPRLVYTLVSIPKGRPEEMSLNLAGPLIINAVSRKAKQFVVDNHEYQIKQFVYKKQVEKRSAA